MRAETFKVEKFAGWEGRFTPAGFDNTQQQTPKEYFRK
jgi:hypothetical protein